MKRKSFNPNNYNDLNNLRNKVIKDVSKLVNLKSKKILEIGCGAGVLTRIISKKYNSSFVYGIDIVKSYVEYCNEKKSKNTFYDNVDFHDIKGTYDSIFCCFALTELLKQNNFNAVLKKISSNLLTDGYVIMIEEFLDDYDNPNDLLGLEIMQELGYRYLNYKDFQKYVDSSEFEIIYTKLYNNKQPILDNHGSKLQIYFENKLNEFDNTRKYNSCEIWDKYKDRIMQIKGIRTYNTSRLVILKKKNNINLKFEKIPNELYLYYSKSIVDENIRYFNDLKIENLTYAFPVKAFPNNDIINLFDDYNFCYDVSNVNEYEMIKKYRKRVFFSDPTGSLQNKKSIRINLVDINSHFGNDYDNKAYEIYHIHISSKKSSLILKKMLSQISKLNYKNAKYLDIGGSYENLSYLDFYLFLNDIRKVVTPKVSIVIEMGSAWFKNAGYLICTVKNINRVRGINYAFVNASRELHAKWSIPFYVNNHIGNSEYIVCGATCYERDLFSHIYQSKIKIGDKLVFKDIEPYSFSFNCSFNGVDKAEVIIDD